MEGSDPGSFMGKGNIQWKCLENRFVEKQQPPCLERIVSSSRTGRSRWPVPSGFVVLIPMMLRDTAR